MTSARLVCPAVFAVWNAFSADLFLIVLLAPRNSNTRAHSSCETHRNQIYLNCHETCFYDLEIFLPKVSYGHIKFRR